jgi:hypothetical protein
LAQSIWIGFFGPIQISTDGTTVTFPNVAVTGQFFGPAADNTALPPYSFLSDTNTGLASSAADTLDLVTGGTSRLKVSTTAVTSTVQITGTSLKLSSLTATRVPFAGTAGLLGDAAGFTYTGDVLSVVDGVSQGAIPATGGAFRAAAGGIFAVRNFANTGNIRLISHVNDASDLVVIGENHLGDVSFHNSQGVYMEGTGGGLHVVANKPHVFGNNAVSANVFFYLTGTTFAGGQGVDLDCVLSPGANTEGSGMLLGPTFVEAASGVHGLLSNLYLAIPTVTPGAATVTNTASLYIAGAMSATVAGANYAIWSDAGVNRFDGDIALGSAAPAISSTAPTAAGTGMAFTVGTGSTAFDWSITITTANAQSAFTLTLPTATNAWTCFAENFTTSAGRQINMTARDTTHVTLTQISTILGSAVNFADGDVVVGSCTAH